MLISEHLRDLQVNPARHPNGHPHLSAASGLVRVGRRLYVVADDENHLGMLSANGRAPLQLIRLFEDDLPLEKYQRKKAKPDLESLVHWPATPGYPFGALLALGSGSTPKRCQAVLLPLDAAGNVIERLHTVDLSPLYQRLRRSFSDLNIEGAFVSEGQVCLLQRGNKGASPNAIVRFHANDFIAWLKGNQNEHPPVLAIHQIDLGEVDGVPLSLTDGAALGDQRGAGSWVFSAVAEDTDNSYLDGACVASVIGIADAEGRVVQMHRLKGAPKVEGISVQTRGRELVVNMVTDADDPVLASQLLRVRLKVQN